MQGADPKGLCRYMYIIGAQRGSHLPTLRANYIPYSYMDPLGDKSNLSPQR